MITFLSILIAGVSTGAIYALISLGFTLAYNSSGMLNLLQGGFVVLGGLLTYEGVNSWHLPLVVSIAVATIVTTAIAAAFHVLVLLPNSRRLSPQNMLLILLGGLILLQGSGEQLWGDFAYSMRPFGSLEDFTVGSLTVPAQVVWIIGLGIVVCAGLTLFLARTHTGKALRAVAQNPAGARAIGLKVNALAIVSFAATGLLGALAGAFVLPYLSVSMDDAATYSLLGIIGISLGGFGSYFGAVVGGVALGVIEAMATGYLSSLYGESFELVALIVILVLRPEGLLRGASRVRSDTGEAAGHVHYVERSPRMLTAGVFGLLIVAGVALPLIGFKDELQNINLVGITALALIGMDVLMGYLGMVSLGQSAFMAVGGYLAALTVMHLGIPTLLGLLIGVVSAVVVAYVFSMITVRLAPYYMATVSLALVLLAQDLGGELNITGGTAGLIDIPSLSVGGFAFDTDFRFYYLIWSLVAVFGFGSFLVLRGKTGRIMKAISFDPIAAASMGVDVRRYRHYAMLYAAALAGLAGALYAFYLNFLAPSEVGLGESFTLIVATVLGGAGTILGPILGGAFFTYLPAISQGFQQWTTVLEGVLVIVVLSLAPSGVLGGVLAAIARLRRISPRRHKEGEIRVRVPLEARELTKSFGGVTAVDNVSFTAEAGSITGIVGPNGAGKTTLFNLLTGIYPADHGQLVVGDATVARSGWRPHQIARLGVARTFQSARVFPNLNVFDNVLVGAEAAYGGGSKGTRRRSAGELADEVSALLTALDLSERSRAPASTLPAGSQKVVELARVLLARPKVLLLDEPASGLSEAETARLADILVAVRSLGITVIIVDHNLRLVMGICDQVVVMDAGAVIASGDPAAVQADPAVRAAYLGAVE